MKVLSPSIISTTRSGNWQYAKVESTNLGLVTIRLGSDGKGTRLTNLNVVGMVKASDLVVVDYSTNVPYVRAVQYWSEEQITLSPAAIPLELQTSPVADPIILDPYSLSYGESCGMIAKMSSGSVGVPIRAGGASAMASSISTAKCIGITAGSGHVLIDGFINGGWSLSVGQYVFLGVSGGLTHTKPTLTDQCVVVLGIPITASILRFKAELVIVELE